MLTLNGFSSWIVVEGKPVPEYLVAEDTKSSRVSCWIPGQEGQKFTVFWKDHGGKVDSCAFVSLDGLVVPGRFLFGNGEASRSGVRSSATTERPFIFQKIEEDEPSNPSANKDVGMITLRIKRIQRVAGRPANPVQQLPSTNLGKRKAGDLSVGFGEHERTFDQFAYTWSVKPYEKDGPSTGRIPKTYVSFVFRYRTREWLQMQGIMPECDIPASPSPPVMRALMRRVSSAPAVPAPVTQETTLITPRASPTPPRKKLKMEKPYLSASPRRPRRPSADMRRTVSHQVTCREPSSEQLRRFDPLEEEDPADPDWVP
ncbi:hypothetical protein DFH08DRAFT_781791 [Mycena albidolilacea]|uniref:DUF7918 domain-containing protein n=1 Tax=Mycena albidolilacea TaxID=1033008 RepID=A0AAD6ZY07_9AGAR|nr:hypothetical protein DFH08DRAFT_781791 [Mycena albidolilacea]